MTSKTPSCRVLLSVLLAMTSACASHIPTEQPLPSLRDSAPLVAPTPSGTPTNQWPGASWWQDYQDPVLTAMVEQALRQAPQMAVAAARVAAAKQDTQLAAAAFGLKADASARVATQRLSDNGMLPTEFLGFNWYEQSDLALNLRYQFDWWGKQRAAVQAASNRGRLVQAEQQATAQALAASVCERYFTWQAIMARVALLEQRLTLLAHGQHLAQRRAAAELDNSDAETTIAGMHAREQQQVAALTGLQQLQRVALAALLAVDAQGIPTLAVRTLPAATTDLPADASLNLLARRSDVQASRWNVEALTQDVHAARASFYPDISLRALAGLSSIDLGRLLRPDSSVPSLGLALDLPVFDGGLRQLRHQRAQIELTAAVAAYEVAVVHAAQEVGSAATELDQLRSQRRHRESQLLQAEHQLLQAKRRTAAGLRNLQPQLEAELALLDERDALLQLQLAQLLADVRLKHALGGNVSPPESKP